MGKQTNELYEFGPFRVEPQEHQVLRAGQPLPLTPKAFDTLLVLVRNSGHLMLKEELMKAVWPDTFVEEVNLSQNVSMLRRALGDNAQESRYIVTVPGKGYRFVGDVKRVDPPIEDELIIRSRSRASVIIEERKTWVSAGSLVVALLAVIALALAAVGYARYQRGHRQHAGPSQIPAALKVRRSVAVLGFQNLSGSTDSRWLSTALSEMVTTELAAGEQVRMVSEEEVTQMKASLPLEGAETLSKDTLARIRQNLGADLVVLGSYAALGRKTGGQVRLDLRLQDTGSGEIVASISESGTEASMFQLVSQVGVRLRERLSLTSLSEAENAALQASLPASREAERLYAEGLDKLREFDALAARDLLTQAVHADQQYALAHSALAEAWSQLGYSENAKSEAKRSFELADKLPRKDRLFIEARYRTLNQELDKALAIYRTLFDFFPDDIEYGLLLAESQSQAGKREDALATTQSLRKLPPPTGSDPRIDLSDALNYIRLGQYPKAHDAVLEAETKANGSGLNLVLARALVLESDVLIPLGESQKALSVAEEARRVYATSGDQFGVSAALADIASAQWAHGDLLAAEKTSQEALLINRKIGNQSAAALNLSYIATVRADQRDLSGARKMYEQAFAIYRETGETIRQGEALFEIAWVVDAQGDPATAVSLDDRALGLLREASDEEGVAQTLDHKGNVLIAMGELDQAQQSCQQALDLARAGGNKPIVTTALFNLGIIAELKGAEQDAEKALSDALRANGEDSETEAAAKVEALLGEVAEDTGQHAEAKRHIDAANRYFHEHKNAAEEIGADGVLAEVDLAEGDTQDAVRVIEAARVLLREVSQDWEPRFSFAIDNARVQAATGRIAEARESLKKVIAESGQHSYIRYQLEARLAMCEVEARTDRAAARLHAKALQEEANSRGFGLIARKAGALVL
jgi:DNA-binding winged helix-turn-helix (wHTH) protein/tetratricopeptide (TPR) repeat protein